ncbi:uncharacterized protein LOC116618466 [Nematostella vectensis]|uniref:uncharacterized protein LOC116618466 n=1 Tax=Nematostella vectensis TaxID=45351 RepID=UPI0020771D25|nr:uncharacterized protein LOC116618466 [Nematostella vectensis]
MHKFKSGKSKLTSFLQIVVAFVSLFVYSRIVVLSSSPCRILTHLYPLPGHALRGHLLTNMTVSPKGACGSYCFDSPECFSYNVGPGSDELEFTCELSDSDAAQHPDDLVPREGFTYHAYENTCLESGSCPSGRVCRIGYEEPYRCTCGKNYTGLRCLRRKFMSVYVQSQEYFHGICKIEVNGVNYCKWGRGHHVAAFSMTGSYLGYHSFDTWADELAGSKMATYIDSLPPNTLVLIAVRDSGQKHVTDAHDALKSVGAVEPLQPTNYGDKWLLIGHKGGPRPWITQGHQYKDQGLLKATVTILIEGCYPHGNTLEKWCNKF